MEYEVLLQEVNDMGLIVKSKPLEGNDGRIKGNRIALKKDLITRKKKCTLAEEIGHHLTTVGSIVYRNDIGSIKQEYKARVWAFQKLLSVDRIIEAASKGYMTTWDMAEYLDVDEEFLKEYLSWQHILDM